MTIVNYDTPSVAFLFQSDFFCCTPFHAISGCGVLRMAILIWNLESSAYYRSPFLCHVAAGRAGWSSSYARQCLVASLLVSAHRRKGIIICTQLSIKWSYTTQTSSFCLFSVLNPNRSLEIFPCKKSDYNKLCHRYSICMLTQYVSFVLF